MPALNAKNDQRSRLPWTNRTKITGSGFLVLVLLWKGPVPDCQKTGRFSGGYLGPIAAGSAWGTLPAILGVFLPGLLIFIGVLPFWSRLRLNPVARSIVAGVNAAVVGILAMALYDPLWMTGIRSLADVAAVGIGLFALMRWHIPPIVLVVAMVVFSGTTTVLL